MSLWDDLYNEVLASLSSMTFAFFPITGRCLSYRSVLNYASHKISRFGWQAPNTLCVAKLYYHIKNTYTYVLYIAFNKCTGTQYIIVIHSTFYILTPSYTYIEDPWRALSRILSIPALHPGLRWHPSQDHNLGDGVYDHFDPMVVAGIPTKVVNWIFMIDWNMWVEFGSKKMGYLVWIQL